MFQGFDASHVLTLAFHEHITPHGAKAKLKKWYFHVMRRLFGRRCFELPAHQTIEFQVLPEAENVNLHFHGVIRVPPNHVSYFESYALPHWKRIAHKSTIDFRPIRPADCERYFNYVTKERLPGDIWHSSMLHDFDTKPVPLIPVGRRQIDSVQTKPDNAKELR
jgi:hypothetical protein